MSGAQGPGRILGNYQIATFLGGGPIGDVFRAQQLGVGDRELALKLVRQPLANSPVTRERFQLTTRSVGRFDHPHILPLEFAGELNGQLVTVTPLVAQGSLMARLARGRLSPRDIAPLCRQMCDALGYSHGQGLAHGNLKPTNVLLFEGRHVLLGDFGQLWHIAEADLTQAGLSAEAVAYMAPEQADGRLDPRSDVYSLGALLFHTLTGSPPFAGRTPFEMLSRHQRQPVPSLAQVTPTLGPSALVFDEVIKMAMTKDPNGRFQTMAALSRAIMEAEKIAADLPSRVMPVLRPNSVPLLSPPANQGRQPSTPYPQPGFPPPNMPPGYQPQPGYPPPGQMPPGYQPQPGQMPPPGYPPPGQMPPPGYQPQPGQMPPGYQPQPGQMPPAQAFPRGPMPGQGYPPPMGGMPPGQRPPAFPQQGMPMPPLPAGQSQGIPADDPLAWLMPDEARRRLSGIADNETERHQNQAGQPGQRAPDFDADDRASTALPSEEVQGYSRETGARHWWQQDDDPYDDSREFTSNSAPIRAYDAPRNDDSRSMEIPSARRSASRPRDDAESGRYPARRGDYDDQPSDRYPSRPRRDDRPSDRYPSRPRKDDMASGRYPSRPRTQDDDSFVTPVARGGRAPDRRPASRKRNRLPAILSIAAIVVVVVNALLVATFIPDRCPQHICDSLHLHIIKLVNPASLNTVPVTIQSAANGAPLTTYVGATTLFSKRLTLASTVAGNSTWVAQTNQPWVTLQPAGGTLSGTTPQTLDVTIAPPASLAPATYPVIITVNVGTKSTSMTLNATITTAPHIKLDATSLKYAQCGTTKNDTITNDGGWPISNLTVTTSDAGVVQATLDPSSDTIAPGGSAKLAITVGCPAASAYSVMLVSATGSATITLAVG